MFITTHAKCCVNTKDTEKKTELRSSKSSESSGGDSKVSQQPEETKDWSLSRFMKNKDIQKILTSIKFLFLLSLLSLSSKLEICDKLPIHTPNSLNCVSLNKHWETWHMIWSFWWYAFDDPKGDGTLDLPMVNESLRT